MFVNVFEYEQWDSSQSEGVTSQMHEPTINYLILTCIATGKSFGASAGKKTSTVFLAKLLLPSAGAPTYR